MDLKGTWTNWLKDRCEAPHYGTRSMISLNRAACHACTLVAETSCPFHNVLLDREVVIGRRGVRGGIGFFAELLEG